MIAKKQDYPVKISNLVIILSCHVGRKRLRDATIVVQTRVFSFVIKKMKAETRFPRTVEAYKAHLHEDRPHYDSFQTFCRNKGYVIKE